ncbi:MAG: HEAT repeat domain-containing protein [Bellilinea sp.]|jgi:HEAT repeat protein
MFGLENLALDRFSFWLGFLGGTLFWLLINRLWKSIPIIKQTLRQIAENNRRQRMSGVESALRQDVLRRAQRNHIGAALFSLDEILVKPELLAPPARIDPASPLNLERYSSVILPCQPDFPEFASRYGSIRLGMHQSLQGGCNIALIGCAGSGKSTALAHLASQIARQDETVGSLSKLFPIYLHILDIDFEPVERKDTLDPLIKAISQSAPVTALPQLAGFIRNVAIEGSALFIIDGLDELSHPLLENACKFLKSVITVTPQARWIVAASNEYLDGLTSLGFEPLVVAGWTPDQIESFISRWGKLWNNLIGVNVAQQNKIEILDDLLLTHWISHDPLYHTPLIWTLKVWGALAGDLPGSSEFDAILAHLARTTQNRVPLPALGILAKAIIEKRQSSLDYTEAEKLISGFKLAQLDDEPILQENDNPPPQASTLDAKAKTVTSGGRILSLALDAGILVEHHNDSVSFSSPVWAGFLAASQAQSADLAPPAKISSALESEYFHYLTVYHPDEWLDSYLQSDQPPLFRNLIKSARWIRDTPSNHPGRSKVMRRLAGLLQNETVPYSIRMSMLAASATSNDPALTLLYKQQLSSSSSSLRSMAVLGLGALQESKSIKEIVALLNDDHFEVRYAACFSLACFDTNEGLEARLSCIHYADESLRLAASETLAMDARIGHEKLRELMQSEDLLVRRSAIFGMSTINENWVVDILEKTAVEDSQWVVRNAAGQALENLQKPNPYVPQPLPHPADSPWLIAFGAKRGLGISRSDSPVAILLEALKSENEDERLASIWYLRNYSDEGVIARLYSLLFDSSIELRDTAFYALWSMSLTGIEMPDLIKYGFSKIN